MLYYLAGLGLTKEAVCQSLSLELPLSNLDTFMLYYLAGLGLTKGVVCQSLPLELSLSNLDTFMRYYLAGLGLTKGAVCQRMLFAKGRALPNFPFTFLRILPYFCSLIRHYAEAGS
ncbi:MAG: hypothetical protein RL246_383 [Bacteroidota bacterium]